jgi:flagellar biosynthesis regulator FlbT
MKKLIESSVTGNDTFKDLGIIRKKYRRDVEHLSARYQNP